MIQIRHFMFAILGCLCFIAWLNPKGAYALDLQEEIAAADHGATIVVPAGEYHGPFTIDKPLSIIGEEGAILRNRSDAPTISVTGERVEVSGLTIIHESESLDSPAIHLTGQHHQLHDLDIRTSGMGILLEQAHENVLREMKIEGPYGGGQTVGGMSTRLGNGIDLFRSDANRIERVELRAVQDGIYIEHSERNIVQDNAVSDSRYGYHLMFTEHTTLSGNTATGNVSGAMVMGTKGTIIKGNRFLEQAKHVHSQGLMLYDVAGATVTDNRIGHNLVGIFIESSRDNLLMNNEVFANHVGMEMRNSESNVLERNDWVANVISARGQDSPSNQISQNYWDGHLGFDVDGDGISEIPFYADGLFPAIITAKPAYQIFAGSPGLQFLHQILGVQRETTFSDLAPMMMKWHEQGHDEIERSKFPLVYYSCGLLLCSWIMYGGRRK